MISLLLISPAPYMSRYVQHLAADSVIDEELHPAVAEDHPRHAKEPGTGCPIIPAQSVQISPKKVHYDHAHGLNACLIIDVHISLYLFFKIYSLISVITAGGAIIIGHSVAK